MRSGFVPFQSRNPVRIGAIGLLVLAMLMLVAFKAGSLPLIGGGTTYYAEFTDSSGLLPNDEVRIAGVRVGKVTDVKLAGDKVRVKFQIKTNSPFGTETGAQIKVKTLLGAMFLALEPAGAGQLAKGSVIPTERTESAYDVVEAFSGLAETVDDLDIKQLRQALNAVSEATENTPEALRSTLKGLSALSENVAARDAQINSLMRNVRKVSGVLSERDQDLVELMRDGDILLRALVERRDAIHRLLVSTNQLSQEIVTTIAETEADLEPALKNLQGVVNLLLKNQNDLDETLRLFGPFYRIFANVLGTGPWFDNWMANMPPAPALGLGQ